MEGDLSSRLCPGAQWHTPLRCARDSDSKSEGAVVMEPGVHGDLSSPLGAACPNHGRFASPTHGCL